MVVKNHRNTRIGTQSLTAGAGSQENAAQVHRKGPDRADAVQAELHLEFRAEDLQTLQIIQNAGGCFTVRAPNPARGRITLKEAPQRRQIDRLAPTELQSIKCQPETRRVIQQALAKLTIAQHHSASWFQR